MHPAHSCPCPTCGSPPDHHCQRANGAVCAPHASRKNIAMQHALMADGVHSRVLQNSLARANMLRANGYRLNGDPLMAAVAEANLARANMLRANGLDRWICPPCDGAGCSVCNNTGALADAAFVAYKMKHPG